MLKQISKALLAGTMAVSSAWAAQVHDFTPTGQVRQIESVQATFDEAVVPFGGGQLPPPFNIECNDADVSGMGRWLDEQRWTYTFDRPLDAGVRCSALLDPDFRTLTNEAVQGRTEFEFNTGGPRVARSRPYGPVIDEDQVFVLNFNGRVDADSLRENTRCAVDDLGEKIPVRLISGAARTQILATLSDSDFADTDATQLIQCTRQLPASAAVQLMIGPGVSTIAIDGHRARSIEAEFFRYEVRPPFTASLSCQRENARSPCLPITSVGLDFSSGISRTQAAQIRLHLPDDERLPDLGDSEGSAVVHRVRFPGPFPAQTTLSLALPDELRDEAGRELSNAQAFPLAFDTAPYPPLVKFASDSFGVVERHAAVPPGGTADDFPATVPLTLRHVEADLITKELTLSAGTVNDYVTQDDQQALRWYARVRRLQSGRRTAAQIKAIMSDKKIPYGDSGPAVDVREVSVLDEQRDAQTLILPGADAQQQRPFEVIGVPVPRSGLHVLEVESPQLGRSLLDSAKPMYVRTLALVTNLGVHLKRGRDDTLVWVTTLDGGTVVPDARINVLDCVGKPLAQGRTDHNGLWHYRGDVAAPEYCEETGLSGLFVSARIPADHALADGHADFSFVMSEWDDGIEAWRFNVPVDSDPDPTRIVHTVLDRTLFRAGETVSMKHFLRIQTRNGLEADIPGPLPDKAMISHQGSAEQYDLDLTWQRTRSGGLSAESSFAIPQTAKVGSYSVTLTDKDNRWYGEATFRVEEFKLPVFSGSLQIRTDTDSSVLVAPDAIDADIQLSYMTGGPARQLPVTLSAVSEDLDVYFQDFSDYSFRPPEDDAAGSDAQTERAVYGRSAPHVFLNKRPVILDDKGGATLSVQAPSKSMHAKQWLFEASFADPNGEIQTLAHSVPVWPASVQAGISTDSWMKVGDELRARVVALAPNGQPQGGIPVHVDAVKHVTYSTRKRLVGGFYSYDNHQESKAMGTVCEGRTGADGVLECTLRLSEQGSIELIATVQDGSGRSSSAATSVWISGADALWFGGNDDDRMDVIPARREWKPGELAEFQVRMPFQNATALVSVEREGVLHTEVHELSSTDPTIRLRVQPDWGPNVYVSVLALRPRMREFPWKNLTTVDWRAPDTWYETLRAYGRLMAGPTTQIDLAKPSFRFGLASIRVSDESDRLDVRVTTDQARYQVGDEAIVNVQVTTPDGTPAAHGTVAFAAVDEALLELSPNPSWDLLNAMRQTRSYGVRTATAQMQVVGRRHYGRKALPAGGGGGKSPTRELLDTLLLWLPSVTLDEQGRARIPVQLNDAITRFRLVAIADHGNSRFGTGSTAITSTRDLQLISGLPQVVRQGDAYTAQLTIRNTTDRDMEVALSAEPSVSTPDDQGQHFFPSHAFDAMRLPAGQARTVNWPVQIPVNDALPSELALQWLLSVQELDRDGSAIRAADRLRIQQTVIPVTPVRVQQSTIEEISTDHNMVLPLAPPPGALRDENGAARGGVQVSATAGPAVDLETIENWFRLSTYGWLEHKASRAIALQDSGQWAELVSSLPAYLDGDGLARSFPGNSQGDEVLTAWLLLISDEARALGGVFQLPEVLRNRMLAGLAALVEGTRLPKHKDGVERDVRKLIAIEALSRYGRAQSRMLDSVRIDPDRWPTSAVIDWLAVLQRLSDFPQRQTQLEQARRILKARLLARGTTLVFPDSALNKSPWLMASPQSNQARLILATLDRPEWDGDRTRLIQGLIRTQVRGTWETSTANLLGIFAIRAFTQDSDTDRLDGALRIQAKPGAATRLLPWDTAETIDGTQRVEAFLPWAELQKQGDAVDKGVSLMVDHNGQGRPWVTVSGLAAVAPPQRVASGLSLTRDIRAVSRARQGHWSVGDVYRVRLVIDARAPTASVMLDDALPAGARILGSGLGGDSVIGTLVDDSSASASLSVAAAETSSAVSDSSSWRVSPTFVERRSDRYRAYFDYLPAGQTTLEYSVRINSAGTFHVPATRVESAYEPDVYGELPPSGPWVVDAGDHP